MIRAKEQKAREYAESIAQFEDRKRYCEEDFKAGWDAALKSQWISIDEALPDDLEYVLVMHKPMSGARNRISIAYLHPTVHSKAWNVEGVECYLNKTNPDDNIVYAWMPIPAFDLI